MTEQEFRQLAAEGFNRVPVVLETFADLDTPLSVYLKLANKPYSYLLESVQGGERFGRYSFIGLPAETRYEVRGHQCREMRGDQLVHESQQEDPLAWVAEQQSKVRAAPRPDLPRFLGGRSMGARMALRSIVAQQQQSGDPQTALRQVRGLVLFAYPLHRSLRVRDELMSMNSTSSSVITPSQPGPWTAQSGSVPG